MKDTWILGIRITNRVKEVREVQTALSKFGCSIRTRLGLHEINDSSCSGCGLILLELTGDQNEFMKLENELLKIEGLEVRKMIFCE